MNGNIIGGEFIIPVDDVKLINFDCKEKSEVFACGRSALVAILRIVSVKTNQRSIRILVPNYICGSVIRTLEDINTNLIFYEIDEINLLPKNIYDLLDEADVVLIINYFGLIDINTVANKIRELNKNSIIIIDDVMNYYGMGDYSEFDYAFTSYRKWFPVPDGARIICNRPDEEIKSVEAENTFYHYKIAGNILKNYRFLVGDDVCLELIKIGEKLLDNEYMLSGSVFSERFLKMIDEEDAATRRKRNAKVLHEGLNKMGINHLFREDAVPMFVPIFIEGKRDNIHELLHSNNIFCPIHWPFDWQKYYSDVIVSPIYLQELSLICDQRYDEGDMRLQLEIIESAI